MTKRERLYALVEERAGLQRRLTEIDAEIDELFEERGTTRPGRRPTKRKEVQAGVGSSNGAGGSRPSPPATNRTRQERIVALAKGGADAGEIAAELGVPRKIIGMALWRARKAGETAQSAPLGEVDIVQPAATNLAPPLRPARGPYRCKACGELGHTRPSCLAAFIADREPRSDADATLRAADLVPCTRCGLRGHTAGDPDRCLYYHGSLGLGGQAATTVRAALWPEPRVREKRERGPFHRSAKGAA